MQRAQHQIGGNQCATAAVDFLSAMTGEGADNTNGDERTKIRDIRRKPVDDGNRGRWPAQQKHGQ